jgi:soluble lytic murein transglycosylase
MNNIRTLLALFLVNTLSAAIFIQAQAASLGPEQQRQAFMQGVQFYEDREYNKAVSIFENLEPQYQELHDYVLFFLAHSYLKIQEEQKALDVFQKFLATYSSHPLTYDVQINTAHLLYAHEDYTSARDLYRRLLGHPDLDQGDIYYRLGNTFLALHKPREAAFSFNQTISYYPRHPSRKQAQQQLNSLIKKDPKLRPVSTEGTMLKQARAFVEARWYKSAIAQYEAIKKRYPNTTKIEECEFGIADGLFRSGQYQEGMKALEQLIKDYTAKDTNIAARALYTIGSKQWNGDLNSAARQTMQRLIKEYPQTSWADNAIYVIGRIYQGEKKYEEAATWYLDVYANYPGSSFAEESLWRAGWSYYQNKQYEEAAQAFLQAHEKFPEGSLLDDTLYWLGRTVEAQQHIQEAIRTYQQILDISPHTYYGLRAYERLQALSMPIPPSSPTGGTEPEISQVLAQLQQILPAEVYTQIRPHVENIFELKQVGLRRHAGNEVAWIESLIGDGGDIFDTKDSRDHQLLLRYYLARLYAEAGKYLKTIRWVSRLESELKNEENRLFTYRIDTFPYRLETLKHPLGYWNLITTYATVNDLDPFLVAAIIRQESAYDPDARSHADARGLMQVLPGTGKRVAGRLNVENFTASRLYEPEMSIMLGTAYFAEMLERFDGNLYRAIAAYNAGPKATNKWWPDKGNVDHEVIIENISYRETRNYVKRVLRDQHQYRQLYSSPQQ